MKKILLISLGFIALAIGGIGIIVPVLPTTPFVLCAAGCFGASSPSLYKKLENTKYFGEYIRNYKSKTGVSRKAKTRALLFLWLTLGISAAVIGKPLMFFVLGTIGTLVSIHIVTLKAKR